MVAEMRMVGNVSDKVYKDYLSAAGNWCVIFIMAMLCALISGGDGDIFVTAQRVEIENYKKCDNDNDCPTNLYCYTISKLCINFITCSQYNRKEGRTRARNVDQCGPCIKGYTTNVLVNGREFPYCQKNATFEIYDSGFPTNILSYVLNGITAIVLVIVILLNFKRCLFKKWFEKINCFGRDSTDVTNTNAVSNGTNNGTLTIATAPIEEQTPFINVVEDKYHVHGQAKDTDKYQGAIAFVPPVWAELRGNAHVPNERNEAPLQNDIPDGNVSTIRQAIIALPEINIEQQDNARNAALQIYPSNDDRSDSSPEPNESNTSQETMFISQQFNQKINMNVNIVKK